jgi:DNA polymerase-3 subunit delta
MGKLTPRQFPRLLAELAKLRAVLLFGPDTGLVLKLATDLLHAVLGAGEDPFRLSVIEPDQAERIPEEVATLAFTGGRRVVRVRRADDRITSAVREALAGPGEGLLLLEAGELSPRSKLRALIESSAAAVAVGCYPEEGLSLERHVTESLRREGVRLSEEAKRWLLDHLGSDWQGSEREIEKLSLYRPESGELGLAEVRALCGDLAGLSLDDALMAAGEGDVVRLDRALERALAEGASPIGVLRAALLHFQRLERGRAAMRSGQSAAEVVKNSRPPLFGRRAESFSRCLERWNEADLARAAALLFTAEWQAKHTGAPAEWICRAALFAIAERRLCAALSFPAA